jgi:hypothetical protein
LTLCALGLRAQSVKWSVPPEYESLEQVTEKLYKVTTVKGVGLVTRDGKVVIEPEEVDKITIFSEGLAVAMKAEKNKNYRLVGIVSEDGEFHKCSGVNYIGEYHRRAAENIILNLNSIIDGNIVLNLYAITNNSLATYIHILSQGTALTNFGTTHDMAKVPYFGSFANNCAIIYIA